MANNKIRRVKYFTNEKKALISEDNKKKYDKYLKSNILKNKDVKNTTYKTYENYFTQFLVYLAEEWDNIDLYSDEFMDNAIDIMEGFMSFCQDTLHNNKKVINTKLSAVSSFYLWSMRRRFINRHPFDGMLERMKNAKEEHIINSYFLTDEQIEEIQNGLIENKDNKYDYMDIVLWNVMLDSANRIGAISNLTIDSIDWEECCFHNVREKEGYIVDVSFSDNTKNILQKWLEYRKENLDKLSVNSLFISKYDGQWNKITRTALQNRIRKIGEIIGLDDFHAHCIRKTASNSLLNKGIEPELVQHFLNHKDVSTTLQFYRKPKSQVEIRQKIQEEINKIKEDK